MLSTALSGCAIGESVKLLAAGNTRDLRERPDDAAQRSPRHAPLLVLALDGVGREPLYEMLKKGELPAFSRLLYGEGGQFPHAYFDDSFLATLPSSTAVAWVTAFTGATPAEHGVAGNEFFIREKAEFAAPVPVTFHDTTPVIKTYTDGYVNKLVLVPTVYERMRKRDPNLQAWVAMHQLHRGADKLLVTDRAVLADAFKAFLETQVTEKLAQKDSKAVYAELDEQVVDSVIDELEDDDEPAARRADDLPFGRRPVRPRRRIRAGRVTPRIPARRDRSLARGTDQGAGRTANARQSLRGRDRRSRPHTGDGRRRTRSRHERQQQTLRQS